MFEQPEVIVEAVREMVDGYLEQKVISFNKACKADTNLLKQWFQKPHVQKFWDNSPEMWQNVESYLNGHKVLYDYWIGSLAGQPFCLVITSDASDDDSETDSAAPGSDNSLQEYCEPHGKTWTVDFMIGEEAFLGKGLSYLALKAFMQQQKDIVAFLIDPEATNTKAIHVYEKAGFKEVGRYTPGTGSFAGKEHLMMKRRMKSD